MLFTVVAARDNRFSRRAVILWIVLAVVFLAYALVIQEIPLRAQITRSALMIQVGTQKIAFIALMLAQITERPARAAAQVPRGECRLQQF